jgi:hypothetical protein
MYKVINPGVWLLIADVSEPSISSIFLGSKMQYVYIHTYTYYILLPKKMELIEDSETSAISNQTPGKHPKENILHVKHGESLKSRIINPIKRLRENEGHSSALLIFFKELFNYFSISVLRSYSDVDTLLKLISAYIHVCIIFILILYKILKYMF